jgi:hypothetical protein
MRLALANDIHIDNQDSLMKLTSANGIHIGYLGMNDKISFG